jgi:hypothetical protein
MSFRKSDSFLHYQRMERAYKEIDRQERRIEDLKSKLQVSHDLLRRCKWELYLAKNQSTIARAAVRLHAIVLIRFWLGLLP